MMCNVLTYDQIDRTEWSRLVASSSTGTWFQTPEAYEFYASQPDLFKPFVVAIPNDASLSEAQHSINSSLQTLRAVCIGYVTVEKNPIRQFFTRRAIIIGGPALADDATDEEVMALMNAVKNLLSLQGRDGERLFYPIYIETRNFNDYSKWKEAFKKAGFEYQPHLNFHVDCTDKEKMWERMSENRKRQIRNGEWTKGRKDERTDVSEKDVREWYEILTKLYHTKVKTPLFPLSFFMEAYRQNIGKFMLVKHDNKVIGGSFCVEFKKTLITNHQLPISACGAVYEWFECGANADYKEQYPSVAATYMGMEYAAEHGFARYDMMGAGEPNKPYGVRDFKAEFGGELVEHGRFLCVMKPILYKIGGLGVKMLKRFK